MANDGVWNAIYEPFYNRKRNAADPEGFVRQMLERTFMEVAMARFEWKGLPPEINKRWMELTLCRNALSVFFKDKVTDKFFAMPGTGFGRLNMVGEYTDYRVIGNDMFQRDLSAKDCVPIWGNYMRTPDWDKIEIYASRIAKADRSIDINLMQTRRTKVMRASEAARLSVDNINRMLDEGTGVLKIVPEVNMGELFDVVDFGVEPKNVIDLQIFRTKEFGEMMNLLGINAANQDKKERLVAAEVSANDEIVETFKQAALNARRDACDQINDMFKLQVSVDYRTTTKQAELKDSNDNGIPDDQEGKK